jgi:hypothetical protein
MVKKRGKVVPVYTMKAYIGYRFIVLVILLDCAWRVGYPGGIAPSTETRCPFNRLGGPQSRSGLSGEVKNSLPLLELERRIVQPVA